REPCSGSLPAEPGAASVRWLSHPGGPHRREGVNAMSERQWERLGSAAGIGFVVAMIVSVFMAPTPPHIDASTATILDYVTDHRSALLASAIVGALAGLLFLVFLGHLRHVLQRAEGGGEALSPIVYGAGLTTVAVALVTMLPLAAL